ncbi:MAG: AmmeMemoRadiSam system protein B [Candidatus Cryosericum sp.]|nr:AmmeMemoRadiSam system protein B [bacterium]
MRRNPVVAGQFYPAEARELRSDVERYIEEGRLLVSEAGATCRALIVPHAGYIYSGPVAGSGYACLESLDRSVEWTVAILAPSHHVWFKGAALPEADEFRTPLGDVKVAEAAEMLARGQLAFRSTQAHALEHAVEVQVPFLQVALERFTIIPLVLGDVDAEALARELLGLGLSHLLVVASSDLSHYSPYSEAVDHDHATIDHILKDEGDELGGEDACGFIPIRTVLALARASGWKPQLLDYRNSGDTAGDRSAVVGYAAIAFWEEKHGDE